MVNSFKQLRMGSRTNEIEGGSIEVIDQKKIAADMTFAVGSPITF